VDSEGYENISDNTNIPIPNWLIPYCNGIMNSKVTLDRAGRLVLPKKLRDHLHLSPGDTLDITVEGDEVKLRPRRSSSPLQKKQGVWVFSTGKPMASDETAEALRDIREQRDRRNSGRPSEIVPRYFRAGRRVPR
jgi:AbrB family looped-hinge helix DNA binding protein